MVYSVLAHPAYSQAYFLRLGVAFAAVLAAWSVAEQAERLRPGGERGWTVALGALYGAVAVAVARTASSPPPVSRERSVQAWQEAIAAPLLVVGGFALVGLVVWAALRHRRVVGSGTGLVLLLAAALIGAPLATGGTRAASAVLALASGQAAAPPVGVRLSPGAGPVLLWLDRHVPKDAVVATNRYCTQGPGKVTS